MQTILVPLDGSPRAEGILAHVRMLALALPAKVRLLHVTTAVDIESLIEANLVPRTSLNHDETTHAALAQHSTTILREHATAYLNAQAASFRADGLAVDVDVREGVPAACIIEVAEDTDDTLIALATHGDLGLQRWAAGSVTDRVVQATSTPVFILPSADGTRGAPGPIRHILVPLDGSGFARQALPVAGALATRMGASLTLLHVIAPVPPTPGVLIVMRGQALQALQTTAATLDPQLLPTTAVALGDPAEAIVDMAARGETDLIVMASHGRSGLRRWALGSVADRVLHASSLPLLLIRPAHDQDQAKPYAP